MKTDTAYLCSLLVRERIYRVVTVMQSSVVKRVAAEPRTAIEQHSGLRLRVCDVCVFEIYRVCVCACA